MYPPFSPVPSEEDAQDPSGFWQPAAQPNARMSSPFLLKTCSHLLRKCMRRRGSHRLHRRLGLILLRVLENATAARADLRAHIDALTSLGAHQWKMALRFLVSHEEEHADDSDPIDVIRNDVTVGRGVLPAENGVEDAPSATTVQFWIGELESSLGMQGRRSGWETYVDVPDALGDIVRSWTCACLVGISAYCVVPVLSLEVPNCSGEETSGHEV